MKKIKKLCSLLLAVLLVITLVPVPQASAASASGQAIVNKAMEYLGKVPYVWGGKTIDGDNPGADCSGFICRIYEKFGFNFWANRTKLRNCGTNLGTDPDVAQLADIVWFDGHVAIYAGKDSKGNHMIIHETGGKYQNVVYTKITVVGAELKGIIRIPGVTNSGSSSGSDITVTKPNVTFALPTDSTYTAKQKITNTNAVVVNKITKASGTSVTKMGVYLYDANGKQIKKYTENVSNVAASTTTYHSWYDINSEVGVTLTPGTKYQYKFFGMFNGVEVAGSTYSFTTTGTAPSTSTPTDPSKTYIAFFHLSDSTTTTIVVTPGKAYGSLPIPEREGYTFDGWFTSASGGTQITASTIFNGSSDINLYAHYTKNAVVEPEPKPEPEPEAQTYTVSFCNPVNMATLGTYTVTNGQKYPMPSDPTREGYTFDGWYTSANGGTRITGSTTVNLTADQTLYAHWVKVPDVIVGNKIMLQINNPKMHINGIAQNIDSSGTMPVIRSSRTLLPVRAVIESMNGSVGWNNDTRTTTMTIGNKTLFLQIGNSKAWDSQGKTYSLDAAPTIINSRTMLPIRFVVEYFGGSVDWDAGTQTVTIEY